MTNKVNQKIQLLEENLKKLNRLKELNKEEFISDFRNLEAGKHLLQTSIEAMIDIANSIIARQRLREPETSADAFRILADNEFISQANKEKYIKMTKFRNRVVHVYSKIDEVEIYNIIQNYLSDYKEFIKEISGVV